MSDSHGQALAPPTLDRVCPLCRVATRERYRGIVAEETGVRFAVDACPDCGHGLTRPVPDDLAPYYDSGYYGRRHGATGRFCNRRRIRLLERHGEASGRSLLDFGSGDGGFLRAARDRGWSCQGVERDRRPATDGPPVASSIDDLDVRAFDRVTFWHVLEHLEDPVGVLSDMRRRIAPRGLVLAAVPNFASWQSRLTGASWLHLDIPRHLHHFTPESIAKTFEAAGFVVDRISFGELEYDVIGWSQSLLNRCLRGRNEFFKVTSGRPLNGSTSHQRGLAPRSSEVPVPFGETSTGGRLDTLRTAIQVTAGLALSAIAIAPAWIESKVGRGGTMIVAARPSEASATRHA